MKSKIVIFILMTLFLVGIVYGLGSVNLRTPAADATIAGVASQNINITFTNTEAVTINCQLQVTSPSTANSTGYNLFNLTNVTSALSTQVNTTINFNNIIFEDSNDYTFTARCENSTTSASDTSTGITIDKTKPGTPTISSPADGSTLKDADTITFDIEGNNVTTCNIYFDSVAYSMTHSASTCTYSVSKTTIANKAYRVFIMSSDGTNTTNSSTLNYFMEADQNRKKLSLDGQTQVTTTEFATLTGRNDSSRVIIIVVVLLLAYLYFNNQGKR